MSLPYSRVTSPWWQHWQSIKLTGGCEGLKRAATSGSLGNRVSAITDASEIAVFNNAMHQYLDYTLTSGWLGSINN